MKTLLINTTIFISVFLLIWLFQTDSIFMDEWGYIYHATFGPLNLAKEEGKEIAPMVLIWLFSKMFSFDLYFVRLSSALVGAAVVSLMVGCSRNLLSKPKAVLLSLSIPFVFIYSHFVLYEIYLLFAAFVVFYGISLIRTNNKIALFCICAGSFLGAHIKANFIILLPVVPIFIYLWFLGKSLKATTGEIVKFSLSFSLFYLLGISVIFLKPSYWQHYMKMRNQYASPISETIQNILDLKLHSKFFEYVLINIGPGFLVSIFGMFFYFLIKKKNILQAGAVFFLFIIINYALFFASKAGYARYLVLAAPIIYFLWICCVELLEVRFRRFVIGLTLFLQFIPLYQTNFNFIFDPRNVKWTWDETMNFFIGNHGTLGYFSMEKKLQELSKHYSLELECDENTLFICNYLEVGQAKVFNNRSLPLKSLSLLKSKSEEVSKKVWFSYLESNRYYPEERQYLILVENNFGS